MIAIKTPTGASAVAVALGSCLAIAAPAQAAEYALISR
jgi:hypothetical protein